MPPRSSSIKGLSGGVVLFDHLVGAVIMPGEGKKELIGLTDGMRESAQSWKELLAAFQARQREGPPARIRALASIIRAESVKKPFPKARCASLIPSAKPPRRLVLELDVGKRLPVGVADDEAGSGPLQQLRQLGDVGGMRRASSRVSSLAVARRSADLR
jgi:hypothetical protein